jgi:enterobactin synthetase component D
VIGAPSPNLFPSYVAQHSVVFDHEEGTDLAQEFPGIELPPSLARAVRKRQVEFCAGRYCAREALRAGAPEHADVRIESGPQGEPVWPPGIVGAITHAHGFASAAIARARDARGLGLDEERVMDEEVAGSVLDQIAAEDEISALVTATSWSRAAVLTVVFSAKETVFKCLYPEVQRYFDFREASVVALDPAAGRFSARLLVPLTPRLIAGTILEGRFERKTQSVCTAMVLEHHR